MTQPAIRVLLVDDHRLVRAGLRSLLSEIEGVAVTGEADNGRDALAMTAISPPDVIVTDIAMAGMNGLGLAEAVRKSHPAVRVIVLSMHSDPSYVRRALSSGASAYLLKDSATSELEIALRAVVRGESYLSPGVSRAVVEGFVQGAADDSQAPLALLTPRQREILKRIAEGETTKEIAYHLELSVKTVETHRTQIMERLDIRDVAGLVRLAIRTGLVSADK